MISVSCALRKAEGIIVGSPKHNREGVANPSGSQVFSEALKLLLDSLGCAPDHSSLIGRLGLLFSSTINHSCFPVQS